MKKYIHNTQTHMCIHTYAYIMTNIFLPYYIIVEILEYTKDLHTHTQRKPPTIPPLKIMVVTRRALKETFWGCWNCSVAGFGCWLEKDAFTLLKFMRLYILLYLNKNE